MKARGVYPSVGKVDTLVILVGETFEPLIQTIVAYQPSRLVAVLNSYYRDKDENSANHRSGEEQWQDLEQWLDLLNIRPKRKPICINEDEGDLGEQLSGILQDDLRDGKRIVIDITGAKKTMVAGAFAVAAYRKTDISYVDFDQYNPDTGKPYGFSCRIRFVKNPFVDWKWREWERVGQLYEGGLYGAALLSVPALSLSTWDKQIEELKQFLQICAEWDKGNYVHAYQLTKELTNEPLKAHLPLAITKLTEPYWIANFSDKPSVMDTMTHVLQSPALLLRSPKHLLIYAEDEYAKLMRMVNLSPTSDPTNYRAAFQRAYSLYEFLIKARVLILYDKGRIDSAKTELEKRIIGEDEKSNLFTSHALVLLGINTVDLEKRLKSMRVEVIQPPTKRMKRALPQVEGKKLQVDFWMN